MTLSAIRRRGLGAIAILVVLTACTAAQDASAGGERRVPNSAESGRPAPLDADAQALVWAGCMRDNGIDIPDPGPGQQGFNDAFRAVADKYDQQTMRRALSVCENLMPQYASEEQHQEGWELELAECLREQGVDVSDDPFGDAHRGDIDMGEFSAAMEECRDVMTGGSW